jgi:hypothetical protein
MAFPFYSTEYERHTRVTFTRFEVSAVKILDVVIWVLIPRSDGIEYKLFGGSRYPLSLG